jgi:hypothetical protein
MGIIITTILIIGWITYVVDKMDDTIDDLNKRR